MPINFDEITFFEMGNQITGCSDHIYYSTKLRRFKDHFGVHPRVIAITWYLLQKNNVSSRMKKVFINIFLLLEKRCY